MAYAGLLQLRDCICHHHHHTYTHSSQYRAGVSPVDLTRVVVVLFFCCCFVIIVLSSFPLLLVDEQVRTFCRPLIACGLRDFVRVTVYTTVAYTNTVHCVVNDDLLLPSIPSSSFLLLLL